jgi:Asp-tRNA(Asn)/Glu-tRNA(Gln) amidotransferase C subunit
MDKKITDEVFESLFVLSNLNKGEEAINKAELEYWLGFFSLDACSNFDENNQLATNGNESNLRSDTATESFDIKRLKSFCHRFEDGFVALPSKTTEF